MSLLSATASPINPDSVLCAISKAKAYGIRPDQEASVADKILERTGSSWSKVPDAAELIDSCIAQLVVDRKVRVLNSTGAVAVVSECPGRVAPHRRHHQPGTGRCGSSRAHAE